MAKPIRATPTLVGEEALSFLQQMKKNDNAKVTKRDKNLIDIIKSNQNFFSSRTQ